MARRSNWNVLRRPDDAFTLLDRSRGEWGEPADDVSCMAINYLSFSLQARGELGGRAMTRRALCPASVFPMRSQRTRTGPWIRNA
jgi:hypothetical protein